MTPILDDTDEYLFHRGHVIRIDFDNLAWVGRKWFHTVPSIT